MATTPENIDAGAGEYGISNLLAGAVIESESITETPQRETVPDQKNAVAFEVLYDKRWDLKLTVRLLTGTSVPTASDNGVETAEASFFKYPSASNGDFWVLDNIESAGSYNGLRRYNISAHRFNNWPGIHHVTPSN